MRDDGMNTKHEKPRHALPAHGRIAGIDYGHARIGLAISDVEQRIASPFQNYTRRDRERDLAYLRRFVADEQVVGIVVGLPLHMSGDESEKSLEAREFGSWIGSALQVPIDYQDERYTSLAAERILLDTGLTSKKRKQRRDMLAAHLILLSYLESSRSSGGFGALDG